MSKELKLSEEQEKALINELNNVCEKITKTTGIAGGIYVSKYSQLEMLLDELENKIHNENNIELENKLSSILDQFINILKDFKEENK